MSEITNFRGDVANEVIGPDAEVTALISRVGERVRKARELKGIPRRVLSEKSGVSPRYLAQLEAGEGNISIGLLLRVAIALDYQIEWFIGRDDPWMSETLRMADLYRSATADVRAQVLATLSPKPETDLRAQRVCLIGMRGAGKSTMGAAVGAATGVPFVELNRDIEEQAGMPVNEVMALYGQEGYRSLEAQALDRVIATHSSIVLAVAGGIVTEPETYENLLRHFHTIWLKASPQEHMDRVRAQGDTRPMTDNPEAMDQLKAILTSREVLYERAHVRLDTTGIGPDQTLRDLCALIAEREFLD